MKPLMVLAWAASAVLCVFPATAQDARQIAEGGRLFGGAPALSLQVTMAIHRPNGIKERTIELFIRREPLAPGSVRLLARIVAPAFLSQMRFLSHRDPGGLEQSWLGTSQGVRKLSQANRGDSLFDSDFTVEDLTELSIERYVLDYRGREVVEGSDCDVVHGLLLPARDEQRVLFVDRADHLIRRVDTLDARGRLKRRYTLDRTQQIVGEGYPLQCTMHGADELSYTVLTFDRIRIEPGFPDTLFSKAAL